MFFIKFIFVSLKIIAKVITNVIIVVILRDFTADSFLYIGYEFLIIYRRAGVRFNIILLIMVSTILWPFMEFVIYN